VAVASPAAADEIFTRSGGHLVGEIVERGATSVTVDIGIGRVELPLSYIDRIVPGDAPLTVYRQRAQVLAPGDVAGWLALGRWARENDLPAQADEAFSRVVARDPGNAAAQQALGRVEVDGQWMTREDANAARGLVLFEGSWISPDEREAVLGERARAAERARAEAEMQTALRESEARVREAEAQARMAEAQARAVEADAVAAERNASAFLPPWAFAGAYVPPVAVAVGPAFVGGGFAVPQCGGRMSRFGSRTQGRIGGLPRGRLSLGPAGQRRLPRTPGCNR
jgi:hypothetical protein